MSEFELNKKDFKSMVVNRMKWNNLSYEEAVELTKKDLIDSYYVRKQQKKIDDINVTIELNKFEQSNAYKKIQEDYKWRHKDNWERQKKTNIESGEWIDRDEFVAKCCPECEHKWAKVLYTPKKSTIHAGLYCDRCGHYHKWMKRRDCKY
tara:strand:+ start:33 stop:482 length:450 start_codon:yes stop_codon:yes gene_type:complete